MFAVIGADGYFGSYILKNIIELTDEKIIATSRNTDNVKDSDRIIWRAFDVSDDSSVDKIINELRHYSDLKIIYLAAYHHPDLVQKNPEYAWNINVTCLSRFANSVRFADQFFYSSTDSVYGNSINNYHFKETDVLSPVNEYGHNKCAAESVVVNLGFNVARFPFLISPGIGHKKHFYDEIVESIKNGTKFEMYGDSYRSSLSFDNAAYILVSIMKSKKNIPQIINICGDKDLSKYDVGLLIADQCGVSRDLIVPISIKKRQQNFETERATSTLMDNSLIKKVMNYSYIDIFKRPI